MSASPAMRSSSLVQDLRGWQPAALVRVDVRAREDQFSIAETIAEPHPSARARPPVVVPGHAVRDLGRLRQPEQTGRTQIETLGPEEAAVRLHRAPLIAKLAEAGVFGETAGDLVELRGGRLLESDEIRCALANRVDDEATTMEPGLAAIGRLVVADVERHRTHASRSRLVVRRVSLRDHKPTRARQAA